MRLAAIAVAAVTVALVVWWLIVRREPALVEFPQASAEAHMGARVAFDDFVGAEACRDCHTAQYAAWRGSTHGRAGGPPSPETVIAPFDGTPIRFADAVVTPSRTPRGEYRFTVRQDHRDSVVYRVDGVIGRGHMVGGGTQGFVSRFADGTIRFLPFDYIRGEDLWFCNTNSRTDDGWVPITNGMALADCGDWPPSRILGTEPRFSNCQDCHGSQIVVAYDASARQYDTKLTSYGVNCESCHGPGRQHVDLALAGALGTSEEIAIRALGTVSTDASLEVCFQCHALKEVLEPGYLPGEDLAAYYSLGLTLVGERPLFPDGRVRTFAYQENHLFSDCYLSGSMTCVDCHDPHSQGYRDIYGQALSGRFADEQCLDCHASKARDVAAHTYHPVGSPGSQCVACHMPYLQHPEVGDHLQFARSDHTIPVPRPALEASLGLESACVMCHQDSSPAALQEQTDTWWGSLKPHKPLVRSLFEAEGAPGHVTPSRLLDPEGSHAMAQVSAVNQLVTARLRPNMLDLDPDIRTRLLAIGEHRDPDVAAVALAALHLAAGHDPAVRRALVDVVRTREDDVPSLRRRWASALGFFGDRYRASGDIVAAVTTYRKGLELLPQLPGLNLNLALAYAAAQNHGMALEQYTRALDVHPDRPLVLVNMGVTLEALGRTPDAVAAYREALALNPGEALAHLNLGNYHLRRQELDDAIRAYRNAVAADPGLARAYYYLGRTYILTNRLDSALTAARNAVQFEPGNAGAREMLRDLERAAGG